MFLVSSVYELYVDYIILFSSLQFLSLNTVTRFTNTLYNTNKFNSKLNKPWTYTLPEDQTSSKFLVNQNFRQEIGNIFKSIEIENNFHKLHFKWKYI
jgi:hypothetical protein